MKAAVIGVGAMGRHHVRVYNEIEHVTLAAVTDADELLAEEYASRYQVPHYGDYRRMLDEVKPDVVTVAVPTSLHGEVALDALDAGIHVLIEKPIAATIEEGKQLIRRAEEKGLVLSIGHIERYNPAVVELKRRLNEGELGRVFSVRARRLGAFPARIRDVGVTLDLSTHDLDIIRYVLESKVVRVYAETQREVHSNHEDKVSALLRFANGTVATLDVDWLTPTKIRELSVTGERGMFLVNYVTQDLYFYENAESSGDYGAIQLIRGVSEGSMTRFHIRKMEPLRLELETFVKAAAGEDVRLATGEDGLAALRLAKALVRSAEEHRALGAEAF